MTDAQRIKDLETALNLAAAGFATIAKQTGKKEAYSQLSLKAINHFAIENFGLARSAAVGLPA